MISPVSGGSILRHGNLFEYVLACGNIRCGMSLAAFIGLYSGREKQMCKSEKKAIASMARQSNIELLRILAAIGVIILHYNNNFMGGAAFAATQNKPLNYLLLNVLEAISVSAVDLFMLISGFFLIQTEKRDLRKPLLLFAQVVIYDIGRYLVNIVTGNVGFSLGGLLGAVVPNNYFVTLYCVLFLCSPYINRLILGLTKEQFKKFIVVAFCIFSVYPFGLDIVMATTGRVLTGLSPISGGGNIDGATIVNFGLMYLLGAYERQIGFCIKSIKKLLIIELVLVLGILVISYWNTGVAWEYCSPLVILSALMQFLIFRQINIGNNKWINRLAKGSFSCYLLHTVFFPVLNIPYFASRNIIVLLLHILGSSVAIYLACWVVHLVYTAITKPLFKILPEKPFVFEL